MTQSLNHLKFNKGIYDTAITYITCPVDGMDKISTEKATLEREER